MHTDSKWSSRQLRKPGKPLVEWLALGSPDDSQFHLGILRNGTWVKDTASGLIQLEGDRPFVFALKLMELAFEDAKTKIDSYLSQHEIDPVEATPFPYWQLLVAALRTDGYWICKAFHWLDAMELSPEQKSEVLDILADIETDKRFDQRLRHNAKRRRHQLRRSIESE